MRVKYNGDKAPERKPRVLDFNLGKVGPEVLLDLLYGNVEVTMTAEEWEQVIKTLKPHLDKHLRGYDPDEDPFPPKAALTEEEEEAIARGKRKVEDGGGVLS